MNKEKEIEKMVNVLCYVLCDDTDYCDDCAYRGYGDCENRKIANRIYEAGYRKADEVRKETAKEIYERVEKWLDEIVTNTREETLLICLLGWIKTKYDVYNDFDEVDE